MRVFRTRGLVWPFLFAPMLLAVWLSSSAGVVEEVSAEPVAQTTTIPTITQRQVIEITLGSDDSSVYYDNCIQYESYPPTSQGGALNEIYIGYCGTEPQPIEPIVSGLRFNTSVLEDIPFEDITDIYIVVAVEKGAYTSDALAPIAIRGHAVTDSQTFANGSWPLGRTNLTTTSASWVMTPWGNDLPDSDYHSGLGRVETPSLLPIVQEMYTTIGWELGNPLTFIFKPTGTIPSTNIHRRFIAKERLTGAHARLVVEYDSPMVVANSYYVESTDFETLACEIAESLKIGDSDYVPTAIITLQWGKPSVTSNNKIVTWITNEPITYTKLGTYILDFSNKYLRCAKQLGVQTKLTIAVSTQNYDSGVNYSSGLAWGRAIARVRTIWQRSSGSKWIDIVSAGDLETSWNTPEATLEWLNGALARTQPFINVASLAGYPETGDVTLETEFSVAGDSWPDGSQHTFYWTVEEAISMTYSASPRIYSLPQMYNNSAAKQWFSLASLTNGQRTVFEGFLTQQGACNQNRPCAGSNTPVDDWNQINNLLVTNYPTNQSKIKMFYFTDICGSSGNRDMCGFTFEE